MSATTLPAKPIPESTPAEKRYPERLPKQPSDADVAAIADDFSISAGLLRELFAEMVPILEYAVCDPELLRAEAVLTKKIVAALQEAAGACRVDHDEVKAMINSRLSAPYEIVYRMATAPGEVSNDAPAREGTSRMTDGPLDLDEAKHFIATLAARLAGKRIATGPNKGGTPGKPGHRLCVEKLFWFYTRQLGREPTTTPSGEFIRFVERVWLAIGWDDSPDQLVLRLLPQLRREAEDTKDSQDYA
jgi:hypothetical protein